MRMWMSPVRMMCRQHLLGEHVESHMFIGTINRGVSVAGYADDNLMEFGSLQTRHDELVAEMQRRGFRHRSPLPAIVRCEQVTPEQRAKRVDRDASFRELLRRCPACRARAEFFDIEKPD